MEMSKEPDKEAAVSEFSRVPDVWMMTYAGVTVVETSKQVVDTAILQGWIVSKMIPEPKEPTCKDSLQVQEGAIIADQRSEINRLRILCDCAADLLNEAAQRHPEHCCEYEEIANQLTKK